MCSRRERDLMGMMRLPRHMMAGGPMILRRSTCYFLPAFGLLSLLTAACGGSRTSSAPGPAESTQTPMAATLVAGTPHAPRVAAERDQELIGAAGRGDLNAVQRLLEQGASVHARDERDVTALIAAAYGNHLAVAEALVRAGADVNAKDGTQQSAYLIATSEGYLDLLRLTLQAGADVRSTDSYNGTGLIRAADRGHVEVIRELLRTGIDVDHVNRLGWTALLEAIILGRGSPRHVEVVRLLVGAGADVNIADRDGVTPLMHARQRGYAEMVDILQRAGAR